MRPIGKPKPGFEKRFKEIFNLLEKDDFSGPSFLGKLLGKKVQIREALLEEWFANQIPTYETIKAPKVGRDKEADDWVEQGYNELETKPPKTEFFKDYQGYYVIGLAKEQDGVPVYVSMGQDENVFRGQFLNDCIDLLGEDLVDEAWETKLADETLDYGNRLMKAADEIAIQHNLQYLKEQRMPPDVDEELMESKLHILYSLAKWLIFYGKSGHGYEADF